MTRPSETLLRDLLAEQAAQGLDPRDEQRLEQLLGDHPGFDPTVYERAAAAVQLSMLGPIANVPPDLMRRLRADAQAFLKERASGVRRPAPAERRPVSPAPLAWGGWLAAAALFVLLLLVQRDPTGGPDPKGLRSRLLESPGTQQVAWAPTEDPLGRGVEGDVVWSVREQRGYMRFRRLVPNDPREEQYQLWIFDRARPDEPPVDGGVFDVPEGEEETIVPIDAKLAVADAALFAVTLEKPGGVVVSKKERLLLTATPE